MRTHAIGSVFVALLLGLLNQASPAMDVKQLTEELYTNPIDPNSFARVDEVKVTHIHLELKVNFDHQLLSGRVVLTAVRVKDGIGRLKLDTLDLKIFGVSHLLSNGSKSSVPYRIHADLPDFGSKLEVDISGIKENEFEVEVQYETSKTARALQWLSPEQTEDKKHPYMFSQCQAINARSLLPCQDTPSVKATYTAEIEVQ